MEITGRGQLGELLKGEILFLFLFFFVRNNESELEFWIKRRMQGRAYFIV
jgi:hypothetical protein